jgi:transposase InsO family protein
MNWNVVFGHSWPDSLYDATLQFLRDPNENNNQLPSHIRRTFRRRAQVYSIENDRLVLRVRTPPWKDHAQPLLQEDFLFTVVKASERDAVLQKLMLDMKSVSTNAHMMADRVLRAGYLGISRRYIHTFLSTHESTVALRVPKENTQKPVVKSFRPQYPFQHWQMDLMNFESFSRANSGYKYVFVAIDIFTKFVYLAPLPDKSQKHVAQILSKWFLWGDVPDVLHSDNGTEFKGANGHVDRLCKEFKVKQVFGDAYSPQTQGFVENKNKQIKTLINYYRVHNNTNRYVDMLDHIAYTINNSKHSVTGYTPMELHRGRRADKNFVYSTETFELVSDATDADLENYFSLANKRYEARVLETRKTLERVANQREQKQSQQTDLKPGHFVYVLTYLSHGTDAIQGTFLRVGEADYPVNPLRVREAGVRKHVTQMAKLPRTLFSQLELKGPQKYYKTIFKIESILKKQNSIVKYILVSTTNNDPVWLKVDSSGRYTREFTRAHLLRAKPPGSQQPPIRPNPLFVSMVIPENSQAPQPQKPNNQQTNKVQETTPKPQKPKNQQTNKIQETTPKPTKPQKPKPVCSIESLLKNKKFLTTQRIFLTSPDRSDDGNVVELAVYTAQLWKSYPNNVWAIRQENDRDRASNRATYDTTQTVQLRPELYNRMGADGGWRFVEHNRVLRAPRLRFCVPEKGTTFTPADTPDTPLVDYKGKLIDPSYDLPVLLDFSTRKHTIRVRYAFNTFRNGDPLGVPTVEAGIIMKRSSQAFTVRWDSSQESDVNLSPEKYGKQNEEIDGWEFENFNELYNIQLKKSIDLK